MSITRLAWKCGRPSRTAWAYSAILRFRSAFELDSIGAIASKAHAPMQRPQPTHAAGSMRIFFATGSKSIAPFAHCL